ncbi:hypothetical protein SAHY_10710 [Salinisphaera hydrothermalis EPR70]
MSRPGIVPVGRSVMPGMPVVPVPDTIAIMPDLAVIEVAVGGSAVPVIPSMIGAPAVVVSMPVTIRRIIVVAGINDIARVVDVVARVDSLVFHVVVGVWGATEAGQGQCQRRNQTFHGDRRAKRALDESLLLRRAA